MDLNKILREMSPQVDKVDAIKLLKLLYNHSLSDEIERIYAARVDMTMLAWLAEKARHFASIHESNADAWLDFLLCLDHDYLQMAVEYINDLKFD